MRTKVLVTGAKGQLATTIKDFFSNNQDGIDFTFVSKQDLDITNPNILNAFFKVNKFKYCINCAAYTNVEQAEKTPQTALAINALGVKNLAEVCLQSSCILIHISTDYVFDGKKNAPYKETDTPNPINAYGKSKLQGEQFIQSILKEYFIIRTSGLYSRYGKNFFKTIVKKINEEQELKVINDQTTAPTSCIELTRFIYFLIKTNQKNFGIFHFSASGEASWYDFAKEISNHFNYKLIYPVSSAQFPSKVNRPKSSVLDNNKAQLIFGNIKTWESGLNDVLMAM